MTDTQAEPSLPPDIFSPDDSLNDLWRQAYQGEILGELLFAGIAAQQAPLDPERAAKMRVLAALERSTKEAIAPALERAGVPTEADEETISVAEALIEASAAIAWEDTLASFEPITAQFTALYRRIGQLDPSEQEAADLLVDHEAALATFARLELAGDRANSLSQVEALPHLRMD
jgi:hypothetical protein